MYFNRSIQLYKNKQKENKLSKMEQKIKQTKLWKK